MILPIKKQTKKQKQKQKQKQKTAATKKQGFFLRFLYWTESLPAVIQSPSRVYNDYYKFCISVNKYQ